MARGFQSAGSVVGVHRLSHRVARDRPRPGIELALPALLGRPLTTGPLGKPSTCSSLHLQVEQGERESGGLGNFNPVESCAAKTCKQSGGEEGREPNKTPCLLTAACCTPWLDR